MEAVVGMRNATYNTLVIFISLNQNNWLSQPTHFVKMVFSAEKRFDAAMCVHERLILVLQWRQWNYAALKNDTIMMGKSCILNKE